MRQPILPPPASPRLSLLAAALACAAWPRPAAAAPDGLSVSGSPVCRVALTRVSYDDPGADDAELVELHVTTFGSPAGSPPPDEGPRPSSPGAAGSDGGAAPETAGGCGAPHPDPGSPAADADAGHSFQPDAALPRALTLSDCGLDSLLLVDGAGGACDTYRTIPLSGVTVPADGYVLICAADSALAAAGWCDVTHAGRAALRAGWLQNGPSDGMAFVDAGGAPLLQLSYEGGPACFGAGARALPTESGSLTAADGAVEDDVTVACADALLVLPGSVAGLRSPPPCPGGVDAGAGAPSGSVLAGADAPDGGAWAPERAPAALPSASVTLGYGALDGGVATLPRHAAPPVAAPSCAVGPRAGAVVTSPTALVVAAALLARLTRRRRTTTRTRPAPRAGSSARSGSAPGR